MPVNRQKISSFALPQAAQSYTIGGLDTSKPNYIYSISSTEESYILSDEFNHRLIFIDKNTGGLKFKGNQGTGDNDFFYPRGVLAVCENIWVCDAYNHRIKILDKRGVFQKEVVTEGFIIDEPSSMALHQGELVLVTDRRKSVISIFNLDGQCIKSFASTVSEKQDTFYSLLTPFPPYHEFPVKGLSWDTLNTISSNGRFFAIAANKRINKYGRNGHLVQSLPLEDSICRRGLVVTADHIIFIDDAENSLVVADSANNRIDFNFDGRLAGLDLAGNQLAILQNNRLELWDIAAFSEFLAKQKFTTKSSLSNKLQLTDKSRTLEAQSLSVDEIRELITENNLSPLRGKYELNSSIISITSTIEERFNSALKAIGQFLELESYIDSQYSSLVPESLISFNCEKLIQASALTDPGSERISSYYEEVRQINALFCLLFAFLSGAEDTKLKTSPISQAAEKLDALIAEHLQLGREYLQDFVSEIDSLYAELKEKDFNDLVSIWSRKAVKFVATKHKIRFLADFADKLSAALGKTPVDTFPALHRVCSSSSCTMSDFFEFPGIGKLRDQLADHKDYPPEVKRSFAECLLDYSMAVSEARLFQKRKKETLLPLVKALLNYKKNQYGHARESGFVFPDLESLGVNKCLFYLNDFGFEDLAEKWLEYKAYHDKRKANEAARQKKARENAADSEASGSENKPAAEIPASASYFDPYTSSYSSFPLDLADQEIIRKTLSNYYTGMALVGRIVNDERVTILAGQFWRFLGRDYGKEHFYFIQNLEKEFLHAEAYQFLDEWKKAKPGSRQVLTKLITAAFATGDLEGALVHINDYYNTYNDYELVDKLLLDNTSPSPFESQVKARGVNTHAQALVEARREFVGGNHIASLRILESFDVNNQKNTIESLYFSSLEFSTFDNKAAYKRLAHLPRGSVIAELYKAFYLLNSRDLAAAEEILSRHLNTTSGQNPFGAGLMAVLQYLKGNTERAKQIFRSCLHRHFQSWLTMWAAFYYAESIKADGLDKDDENYLIFLENRFPRSPLARSIATLAQAGNIIGYSLEDNLDEKPTDNFAFWIKACALAKLHLEDGDPGKALDLISPYTAKTGIPELAFLQVELLLKLQKNSEAAALLNRLKGSYGNRTEFLRLAQK